ncbi:MAG: hypothetical protein JRF33_16730 [Deltaproteobacteria bacterium]|nr:hypothetical protein [Deltaproteobacteria bacterium]
MPPKGSAEWKKLNREMKILRAKQASSARLMPKDAQRLAWLEERMGDAAGVKRIRIKEEKTTGPTTTTSDDSWATEMDKNLVKETEDYELKKAWEKDAQKRAHREFEAKDSRRGRSTFKQKELSNFAVNLTDDLKDEGFQETQEEEEAVYDHMKDFGRKVSYAKDESERLVKKKRRRDGAASNPFAIDLSDGMSDALDNFKDFSTVPDTAAKSQSADYGDDDLDELPDPRGRSGQVSSEIEKLYEAELENEGESGRSLGELTTHEVDESTREMDINEQMVEEAVDYAEKEGLVEDDDGRWAVDERGRDIQDRDKKEREDDRFEYSASDAPSSLSVNEVEEEDLQDGFDMASLSGESTQEVSDMPPEVMIPDPPPAPSGDLGVLILDPPPDASTQAEMDVPDFADAPSLDDVLPYGDDLPDMSDGFDEDLPDVEIELSKPSPSAAPPPEYEHKEEFIEAPDLSGEDGLYSAPDLSENSDVDVRQTGPLRLGFVPDGTRMDEITDEPTNAPDLSDMLAAVDEGGDADADAALSDLLKKPDGKTAATSFPEDPEIGDDLEFKLDGGLDDGLDDDDLSINLEVEEPEPKPKPKLRPKPKPDPEPEPEPSQDSAQQSDELDSFWGLVDEMEAAVEEDAPAEAPPPSTSQGAAPLPALGISQAAPKPAKASPSFDDLQPAKEDKGSMSLVGDIESGGMLDDLFGGGGADETADKPAKVKPKKATTGVSASSGQGISRPSGPVMINELTGERKATVHFKDGVNRRGVIQAIDTDADLIHLADARGDGPGEDLVALSLKAIFLMLPRGVLPPEKSGYSVHVRMMDGRDLDGYTPDYDPNRKAFTLFPNDERGNIERVIVFNDAIKNIWFDEE